MIKTCGVMIDTGKTFVQHQNDLANSLKDLSACFIDDISTASSLNKLIMGLQEMNKFHTMLLDQASRTILKNLTSFVKKSVLLLMHSYEYRNKTDPKIYNTRGNSLHALCANPYSGLKTTLYSAALLSYILNVKW